MKIIPVFLTISLLVLALPTPAWGKPMDSEVAVDEPDAVSGSPALLPDTRGHWAAQDIANLWARGVVEGFPDGTFRPAEPVTRAQWTKMLVLALGYGEDVQALEGVDPWYSDLDSPHWAAPFVAVASETGLVLGYGDGTFRPDREVSRAEMAAMAVRALGLKNVVAGSGGDAVGAFRDAAEVPPWAVEYVALAAQAGLVTGYKDGTLQPLRPATRAEATTVIARVLEARGDRYDLSGVVSLAGRSGGEVSLRTAGEVLTLEVAPGVVVFKNGVGARLEDIQPLDELYVVLDGSGRARYLEARYLDLLGTLVETGAQGAGFAGPDLEGFGPYTWLALEVKAGQSMVGVPVPDEIPVFLNGRRVQASLLRPGDRVYLAYDSRSGTARLVDAVRLDYSGRIVGVAGAEARIVLDLDGEEREFRLDDGALVYIDGHLAGTDGLRVLKPGDRVGLATDPDTGLVTYLEATPELRDFRIFTRLLVPPGSPGPSSRLNRGEEAVSTALPVTVPVVAAASIPGLTEGQGPWPNPGEEVMRIAEFRELTAADGRGMVIAVIDTGVDAGHPDLQLTTDGRRKIIDWVDFTAEGRVNTGLTAMAQTGYLETVYGRYKVGSITSRSGRYRYGLFREAQLDPAGRIGQDINLNGETGDVFGVLVTDLGRAGVYDAVFVDTDGDHDFTDEVALQPYRQRPRTGRFGTRKWNSKGGETVFVVTAVSPDGEYVQLGFDGNGHGTHVAGIAAANGPPETGMQGLAPGAQIMALKALGSSGDGTWEDISRAMVYAAEHGADIISISVGGLNDVSDIGSKESRLIEELSEVYGTLIVLVAGNDGPGLGSITTPGDPMSSLTVGAFVSAQAWEDFYGYQVPGGSLWPFSAAGPRKDGSLAPNLVAPGMAFSTVPFWLDQGGYHFYEGTSIAVPHAAGAAALLLDAARESGLDVGPLEVKKALEMGARPLEGYSAVEQGFGLIDVVRAWRHLQRLGEGEGGGPGDRFRVTVVKDPPAEEEEANSGIAMMPGEVIYSIRGREPGTARLTVRSQSPWVQPDRSLLFLVGDGPRELTVDYDFPAGEQFYSGLVEMDDPRTYPVDGYLVHTMVKPYRLGGKGEHQVTLSGRLGPSRYRRYFFEVLPGTTRLEFRLKVPGREGKAAGRVRLHLFWPGGREMAPTSYVGRSDFGLGPGVDQPAGLPGGGAEAIRFVDHPIPGVWEVVVLSDPGLSRYDLTESTYQLEVRVHGVWADPLPITFTLPAGEGGRSYKKEVVLERDPDGGDLELLGAGLWAHEPVLEPELVSITPGTPFTRELPPVEAGTVHLQVSVGSPSDSMVDLDLYLYRWNPETRQWEEFASSREDGNAREKVEVEDPPPGRYLAYVEAYGLNTGLAFFQYQEHIVSDRGQVTVSFPEPSSSRNDKLVVEVEVKAPAEVGRYWGEVLVVDTGRSETIAVVPVRVDVGRPHLVVDVGLGNLVNDQKGYVTVLVYRLDTLKPVETEVWVNGKVYFSRGGRFTFRPALDPQGGRLEIRIDNPDFEPYRRLVYLNRMQKTSREFAAPRSVSGEGALNTYRLKLIEELRGDNQ